MQSHNVKKTNNILEFTYSVDVPLERIFQAIPTRDDQQKVYAHDQNLITNSEILIAKEDKKVRSSSITDVRYVNRYSTYVSKYISTRQVFS